MFSNESLTQLLENLKRNFLAACEASLAYEVFAHPVQRFSTADLGKVPGELEVSIARGPSPVSYTHLTLPTIYSV